MKQFCTYMIFKIYYLTRYNNMQHVILTYIFSKFIVMLNDEKESERIRYVGFIA